MSTAKVNLGHVGFNPRGAWSSSVTYYRLDLVQYNGDSYVALIENGHETPEDGDTWMLCARHGEETELSDNEDGSVKITAGSDSRDVAATADVTELKEDITDIRENLSIGSYGQSPIYNDFAGGLINNPVIGSEIAFGTQTWFYHYWLAVEFGDEITLLFRLSNANQYYAVGTDDDGIVTEIFPLSDVSGVQTKTVTIASAATTKLYCGTQTSAAPPNIYASAAISRIYTVAEKIDEIEGNIPDYLDDEYNTTLSSVRDLISADNCAVIGFMTDLHMSAVGSGYNEGLYRQGVLNTLTVGRKFTRDLPLDVFVFGGDYIKVQSSAQSQKNYGIDNITDVHNRASKYLCPHIVLAGNHELGYYSGGTTEGDPGLASCEVFQYCHKRDLKDRSFVHINNLCAVMSDDKNALFYIFLSSGGNNYDSVDMGKIKTLNTENYPVIVFAHFSMEGTSGSAFAGVQTAITRMTTAGLSVIAWIGGHNHADWHTTYNGVHVISCVQSGFIDSNPSEDGTTYTHTALSGTESALSIFVIDQTTKQINCIRYGAGVDRVWTYGD